jgi:hypothetical protein
MRSPQQTFNIGQDEPVSDPAAKENPAIRWLVHRPDLSRVVCIGFADILTSAGEKAMDEFKKQRCWCNRAGFTRRQKTPLYYFAITNPSRERSRVGFSSHVQAENRA